METKFLQLIPADYTLEVICYEVRGNELAEVVSAHKAVILPVEILTEQFRVMLLKDFSLPEHILNVRNQRKGSLTRFGFKLVIDSDDLCTRTIGA